MARFVIFFACSAILMAQEFPGDKIRYLQDHQLPIPNGSVRSIAGSSLVFNNLVIRPNGDYEFSFLGTCQSANTEWWDRLSFDLGPIWTIVEIGVSEALPGSLVETPVMAGVGTSRATWSDSGYPCSGFGFLNNGFGANQAIFTVVASTPIQPNGCNVPDLDQSSYQIEGDHWQGGTESLICSNRSPCLIPACMDPATVPIIAGDIGPIFAYRCTPTLGEWAMLILLVGLLAAGVWMMRKRRLIPTS